VGEIYLFFFEDLRFFEDRFAVFFALRALRFFAMILC
jgi:hypothetical protein